MAGQICCNIGPRKGVHTVTYRHHAVALELCHARRPVLTRQRCCHTMCNTSATVTQVLMGKRGTFQNASKMRQKGLKNASKMRGTPLGENTFCAIPKNQENRLLSTMFGGDVHNQKGSQKLCAEKVCSDFLAPRCNHSKVSPPHPPEKESRYINRPRASL